MSALSCDVAYTWDVTRDSIQTARTAKKCCECGMEIPIGEIYYSHVGIADGYGMDRAHQHIECFQFARYLNHIHPDTAKVTDGCIAFGQVTEASWEFEGWDNCLWVTAAWLGVQKRVRQRLDRGLGPWLCFDEDGHWMPDGPFSEPPKWGNDKYWGMPDVVPKYLREGA